VSLGECNSADTVRLVSTRLERVAVPDLPGAVGVAVTCRTLRETPARSVRPVIDGDASPYRNPDGTVVQCAVCRRTRRPGFSARPAWEFVPSLIRSRPAGLAFAFCEGCEGHYLRSAS
jgi:MoaA/NifB/PqqE/SkfB family radical SAM enzyme